jgi:hypothetical protein
MKKLLLAAVALGLVTVSCGTKESSMSTANSDSAKVDNTMQSTPATTDTMNTSRMNTDSVKSTTDSAATATPAR